MIRNMRLTKLNAFLVTAWFTVLPNYAHAVGFEILAPHRAVYDVTLKKAEERSGIRDMKGRIVYEVTGNECEGISIRYRFVTNVTARSDLFVTDQRTITHESADGAEFSFLTKSFVNEVASEKVEGTARSQGEHTVVTLKEPNKTELELKKSMFVTSHLVKVISAALKGEAFVQSEIFDGTGKADEVVRSTSFIGQPKLFDKALTGENENAVKTIEGKKAWPVTTSYFDLQMDNTSESLPIYEASFLLYEDGVSRELTMTYPDYSLEASLSDLRFLEKSACE